jgi:TatD DNase family protein
VIDSHAHLGVCEPPADELVAAARQVGVGRILTIGLDEATNAEAIAHAEAYPEVFASIGRHPNSAAGFDDAAADAIRELATHPEVRAIGETGLDYFRDRAPREEQMRAFAAQIEIAGEAGLPLVIHMRESIEDAYATLAERADGVTVILHCFSGTAGQAAEAAERGWYCSFAGNVTYPKAEGLREAAAVVPSELLLVETDSPFLAPQPVRGKPNEPANVVATAEQVAEARGVAYEELDRTVEQNAGRLLGW